jgi:hypothetical protein
LKSRKEMEGYHYKRCIVRMGDTTSCCVSSGRIWY